MKQSWPMWCESNIRAWSVEPSPSSCLPSNRFVGRLAACMPGWAAGVVIFVSGSPQEVLQRCVASLTFLTSPPRVPVTEDPSPLQPCEPQARGLGDSEGMGSAWRLGSFLMLNDFARKDTAGTFRLISSAFIRETGPAGHASDLCRWSNNSRVFC